LLGADERDTYLGLDHLVGVGAVVEGDSEGLILADCSLGC
jgi:hypothetical protein